MSDPVGPPRGDRIIAKLFGAMLMAVGGLIAVLSGLCSAVFLMAMLANATRSPSGAGSVGGVLALIVPFGGVPIIVGVGVFFLGRAIYRGP